MNQRSVVFGYPVGRWWIFSGACNILTLPDRAVNKKQRLLKRNSFLNLLVGPL